VFAQTQTSAVEVPSPKVLPIVTGLIIAVAVIGFLLGLKAGDRGGSAVIDGIASSDAAALARAPNAAPIILNPTETAPPPPPAPKAEEEVVEEVAVPVIETPPTPVATPAPVTAPSPEASPPPPAAQAEAIY